jgi:hypothetical protein
LYNLRIGDRLSPIVRVQSALLEGCLSAEECKSFIQVASNWVTVSAGLVGIVSAILALRTYTTNSKRERAKLAVQLFEKFYEGERYKKVREALDCLTDEPGVKELVKREPSEFTDYLNFFEFVAHLAAEKQLSRSDVLTLFDYYLRCMKRHRCVMNYLNEREKGFEQLNELLGTANL